MMGSQMLWTSAVQVQKMSVVCLTFIFKIIREVKNLRSCRDVKLRNTVPVPYE